MSYTDQETRKEWADYDKYKLNEWADEFDVDAYDVYEHYLDSLDEKASNDINTHIYGVFYFAGCRYLDKLREYCGENNIDYEDTKLDSCNDSETLNIYTNYADSGFDSEIGDLITLEPEKDNILKALKILEIETLTKEDTILKEIENLSLDLELPIEIKIVDSNDEIMLANHITVNYYDENNNLLLNDLSNIFHTEIYFSKQEENELLKVADLINLIELNQNVEFLVDYQDDNFNIQDLSFEIKDDKLVLNLDCTEFFIDEEDVVVQEDKEALKDILQKYDKATDSENKEDSSNKKIRRDR
jgi:hypothetical protein